MRPGGALTGLTGAYGMEVPGRTAGLQRPPGRASGRQPAMAWSRWRPRSPAVLGDPAAAPVVLPGTRVYGNGGCTAADNPNEPQALPADPEGRDHPVARHTT